MVSGSGVFVRRRVVGRIQCWVLRSGGIGVPSQKGACGDPVQRGML